MTDPTREAFPVDAETINLALDAWFDGDCSRPHYDEHIYQMRAAASVIVAALSRAAPTPPAEHIETVMELEHEGRRFTVPGWIGPHIAELLAKDSTPAAPSSEGVGS